MPEAAQDDLLARQRNWITEMREPLMLMAAFATMAAFRANLYPPGGFWRDDNAGHTFGQPVMPAPIYAWYSMFNTMAFVTSVVLAVLVSSERFYCTGGRMAALILMALFDVGCLVSAFIYGTCLGDPSGAFVYLLAPVGVCVLVLCVVYIRMMPAYLHKDGAVSDQSGKLEALVLEPINK